MMRTVTLAAAMLLLFAGAALAGPTSATEFLDLVQQDQEQGLLSAEEALLVKFQHVFDRASVPEKYRAEELAPLKCATPMIIEFQEMRDRLSRETVEAIDAYLAEPEDDSRLSYVSPGGNFNLVYYTAGSNAVPAEDTNPANGVPDYVEKIATYFDTSWDVEVATHRFQAPPIGSGQYQISFEQQGSYGYTTIVNYNAGSTRIVMHPTYVGFPPNNDPEGDVWGAAKVTAAHEFKHATQFATSRWSEGGWNEVDATWAEELVYDVVDDYYNYLYGESPIRQPTIPLDGGSQSTGSYEDCVFELWMSQTWGVDIIYDYWEYRRTHGGISVMNSWETILGEYGVTLAEGWAMFTAWNYGTGYRAVSGVGYEEAADYPAGNFQYYTNSYPWSVSGSAPHLAANFIRLLGLNDDMEGTVDLDFNGADTGEMTLSVHIEKADGTGAIETVTLDEFNDAQYSVQVPMEEIVWAGVIVGNATKTGNNLGYTLNVVRTEALPEPAIEFNAETVDVSLGEGGTAQEIVALTNNGEAGSVLDYDLEVWGNLPVDPPNKSVSGSTLTTDISTYLPGTTFDVEVTVFNGSQDEEWIKDVDMDFPAGVTLNAAENFAGGFYGDLVHDGTLGDGVAVNWHGTVGAPQYGVIREGESASATLSISVDSGFSGDIVIPSVIGGDTYGADPHTLDVDVVLTQASPEVAVTYPNGGEQLYVGDAETITWDTFGTIDYVNVDFSEDGGQTWDTLAENIVNTGSLDVTVGSEGTIHALVRVSDAGGDASDVSDAEFVVVLPVSWLAVSPMSGSIDNGQSEDLSLDFDATGVSNGAHQAWILVSESQEGQIALLPVTLTVTGGTSGVNTPAAFVLNGAYPNPFNPMTKISFNLPAEARTTVEVLDVRGRLVRTLHTGVLAEGAHELTWNGRDDSNQVVAAGLYLARLRTEGYEATVKMTLAK